MANPVKVGVVGCGNISATYLKVAASFPHFEVAACADLDLSRARARADEFGIARACTVEELLADPSIDVVLNLTIPRAHGEVAHAALQAGKSVYNEKPLALDRAEGQQLLDLASSRGLLVGCAPDTFLGGGLQTCRKLIDDGWIGEPVAATAFMMSHGHENWHPDPDFYYQRGGGPLFDMGPYYLTALVSLMGPVRRVTGSTRVTFPTRTITSQPKYGTTITVNTPTHVTGVLDFTSGAVATMIMTFDVWGAQLPPLEIYGTTGSLALPDPNTFGGPVRLRRAGSPDWSEVPLTHGYTSNYRGLGLADMAASLRAKRPHRANGRVAQHVLDIMHAVEQASQSGAHVALHTSCERPAALPLGLRDGQLDD